MTTKLTLAAIAFAALTGSSMAAEAPNVVRASVEVIKNGKVASKVELSMLEGQATPYSNTTSMSYVSDCEPNGKGEPKLKLTEVVTGLKANIKPIQVTADGTLLSVSFDYSELDSMKPVNVKGCAIEIPGTHGFSSSVAVKVKPGQQVDLSIFDLPGFDGRDKYNLIIRGL